MSSPKRILVLGASGMIGRAVVDAARHEPLLQMVPASHRDLPGHLRVAYASLTTPDAWAAVLHKHRIDAVVNCVGIWSGTDEAFELLQYTVPVALIDACTALRRRIVHVSALGFSPDSPLPYASTKARTDRYLLTQGPTGVAVLPSLVFGSDGNSTRFFLSLAAWPVQADLGLPRNLQPVHVDDVANAIVGALVAERPERTIECAGTHAVTVAEYTDGLRAGMGLGRARVRLSLPRWVGRTLFAVGERVGSQFVNHQTWTLLQDGTRSQRDQPHARPYASFASPDDLARVRDTQLYWAARVGMAFLWLWTAVVTWWHWPRAETMGWLDALWPGLGTPLWLGASAALDAAMGVATLLWPRTRLWQAQFALVCVYSLGVAVAMPVFWAHPFGPLTKNVAVLVTLLVLMRHEGRQPQQKSRGA